LEVGTGKEVTGTLKVRDWWDSKLERQT